MTPIDYNPLDPYFIGEVFDILLDPTATIYKQPPPGHVYNPNLPVQNFTYPANSGVLKKLQFIVDENGDPQLATYIITPSQATKLNMVTNPTLDQVSETMPLPLVPLGSNQKIVLTREASGLFTGAQRWMVVDITKTPTGPIVSPSGGSYTDADRQRDNDSHAMLKKILAAF